jgi:hypothetical protein
MVRVVVVEMAEVPEVEVEAEAREEPEELCI